MKIRVSHIFAGNRIWSLGTGFFAVVLGFLPQLLLGEGGVYTYHDQLDGEIFTYLLRARHGLFFGGNFAELMNGIPKEGLQMAAPVLLVLFLLLPPLWAMFTGGLLVALAGFFGMYGCVRRITGHEWFAAAAGVLFAYIPFYTVYGLSIMGIPLLLYAFMRLWDGGRKGFPVFLIVLYGFSSSFVLVGYACVGFLGIAWLVMLVGAKREEKRRTLPFLGGILLLVLCYLAGNAGLFMQVLGIGSGGYVSHKEEIVVVAVPFWENWKTLILNGSMHANGVQKWMLPVILAVVPWMGMQYKKLEEKEKQVCRWFFVLGLCNLVCSLFSAFYKCVPVVAWRNQTGGVFCYTQLDRVYWLMPALWHLMFSLSLWFLWRRFSEKAGKRKWISAAAVLILLAVNGANVLWNSSCKVNVRQLINPRTSNSMTWEKYYCEELFAQIRDAVGRPQEEYRCLCIGIDPAVALYNGFYCLDGYSNNYELAYKREFRKLMEETLEKSAYLQAYFDHWGNRCYFFTEELSDNYYVAKGSGLIINDLKLNLEQAKKMGCTCLFSAVRIGGVNGKTMEEAGLEECGYFETKTGYFGVWLYCLQ